MGTNVTRALHDFLKETVFAGELVYAAALFGEALPILERHATEGPGGFAEKMQEFLKNTQLFGDQHEFPKWVLPRYVALTVDNFDVYLRDVPKSVHATFRKSSRRRAGRDSALTRPVYDNFIDKFGIERVPEDDYKLMARAGAIRDVVVHNRARVDDKLRKRTRLDLSDGADVQVSISEFQDYHAALQRCAKFIDGKMLAKYPDEDHRDTRQMAEKLCEEIRARSIDQGERLSG
jgi:hypothetical protein